MDGESSDRDRRRLEAHAIFPVKEMIVKLERPSQVAWDRHKLVWEQEGSRKPLSSSQRIELTGAKWELRESVRVGGFQQRATPVSFT